MVWFRLGKMERRKIGNETENRNEMEYLNDTGNEEWTLGIGKFKMGVRISIRNGNCDFGYLKWELKFQWEK